MFLLFKLKPIKRKSLIFGRQKFRILKLENMNIYFSVLPYTVKKSHKFDYLSYSNNKKSLYKYEDKLFNLSL